MTSIETPKLTERTVTVDQCCQILIELGWSLRTIKLLLDVPPRTKPFAAGSYWLTIK